MKEKVSMTRAEAVDQAVKNLTDSGGLTQFVLRRGSFYKTVSSDHRKFSGWKIAEMIGPGNVHNFTKEVKAEPVTVDITPESLKTPEGRKAVAEAQKEWDDATHELANVLKELWARDGGKFTCDEREWLSALMAALDRKQEAFMRALASVPEKGDGK